MNHPVLNSNDLISSAYDPEFVRECGASLVATIFDHLSEVQSGKGPVQRWVAPAENIELAKSHLDAGSVLEGRSANDSKINDDLRQRFEELVQVSLRRGQNLNHPHYIGHQVPAPLPLAGLFDAVTTLTNQVQGVYEMGPWGVAAERAVVDTIGEAVGFSPGEFGGLITSGGSLANLTALLAARNTRFPEVWRQGVASSRSQPVMVVQADSHYCVDRAAGVMGMGTDQVRRVPLDDSRRMNVGELSRMLVDLRDQQTPVIAVVAAACTTPTGAFDPLDAIADVCQEHNVWLHVDAAHGGAACLSKTHRHLVSGLQRADSVVFDAHKMMFLPAVCAFVFYKNRDHRFAAFQQAAPYLFDPSAPDMSEYDNGLVTFECTKRAAALGLWGVWSMFGPALFEQLVDQVFATARSLYDLIQADDSMEAACEPTSNIVVFRYLPDQLTEASPEFVDSIQLQIRRVMLESGYAYLTQTKLHGRIHLRSTIMNPLTQTSHLQDILAELKRHGSRLSRS